MALYNYSKDCSCVCKYISIIRHFSEDRNRNMDSALLLNSGSEMKEGVTVSSRDLRGHAGPRL